MKLTAGWIAAVCVLTLPWPCRAQTRRLSFGRLSVEDGLSHAWVLSVLKDSRGFLWFGTQDGLNRYDGASFRIYRCDKRDPTTLPSPVAAVLFEDSRKTLWVGSGWGNAGLARYDRVRERFERFLPNPGQDFGNNVRAIVEDGRGQLWLGTDNGIAQLDPRTGIVKRYPLSPDQPTPPQDAIVSALHEDRQGRLWVGSYSGLFRFDRQRERYERWPRREGAPGLRGVEVWAFYEEQDGVLWVGTLGKGLHRLDLNSGRDVCYLPRPGDASSIANARVRQLVPDGKGHVYVGTENGGLDVLDLRTRQFAHNVPDLDDETSLRSTSIWSLYLDDQGILWIGTYNSGVNYVSPATQRFRILRARRAGLDDPHVSALMEDRAGNLWIGTDGGGLNRLDARTGKFSYFRHDAQNRFTLGSNAVWAVFEDDRRRVWVGGWDSGVGLVDPTTGRVTRFRHDPDDPESIASDHVWRILQLSTGEVMVLTHMGAHLFDERTQRFTRLSQRYPGAVTTVLFSAAEDREGGIWLVGPTYVGRLDRRTGQAVRYRDNPSEPTSLGSGWNQAILVDSVGNVWLGTEGGLGCVAAKSHAPRHYSTSDGLPNNSVTAIQEDSEGNLWLGTNRGLGKLLDAIHVPEKPRFVGFDVHDGLAGSDFARNASCAGRGGQLFFGGSQGLTAFSPADVRKNGRVPPVVLTDLRLFNRSAEIGTVGSPLTGVITETSDLTLSYRHSMVTFEFAALNFVIPQKNRYAYMLEGFDAQWNEVGAQHSATYTNLPDGRFTFRVRGSNNDGVWNNAGVALAIRVTPPFWRTRWFLAVGVLALVGAALTLHRRRLRQHLHKERELQERVTAALADIKTLRGLLPVCAWCKKVRDDKGYWSQLEEYVSKHTQAAFSHGICPECHSRMQDLLKQGQDGDPQSD